MCIVVIAIFPTITWPKQTNYNNNNNSSPDVFRREGIVTVPFSHLPHQRLSAAQRLARSDQWVAATAASWRIREEVVETIRRDEELMWNGLHGTGVRPTQGRLVLLLIIMIIIMMIIIIIEKSGDENGTWDRWIIINLIL